MTIQGGNMKKLWTLLLTLVLAFALVACSTEPTPNTDETTDPDTTETDPTTDVDETEETEDEPTGELTDSSLYLITDVGTIDDKSFNQGAWEGLEMYAKEVGVKANYIQPLDQSDADYTTAISQAVDAGAEIIVTPGFLFGNVVLQAQEKYPDVKFVLVDSTPNNGAEGDAYVEETADNTVSILYKEEQAGFLAGYAAVKEGFTNLGFMGGMAVPAVVRFGYGYAAGADYAAKEMGVDVTLKYTYLNSFGPDPQFVTMAGSWYNEGVEVIHAAAGGAGNSVMAAAEEADKWMIGVDIDQKDESPKVLTSAMKNLKLSVYDAVKGAFEGEWQGGEVLNLGVEHEGVQISDDFSRFENFTEADYEAVYQALIDDADGLASNIPTLETTDDPSTLEFDRVTIEVVQ